MLGRLLIGIGQLDEASLRIRPTEDLQACR